MFTNTTFFIPATFLIQFFWFLSHNMKLFLLWCIALCVFKAGDVLPEDLFLQLLTLGQASCGLYFHLRFFPKLPCYRSSVCVLYVDSLKHFNMCRTALLFLLDVLFPPECPLVQRSTIYGSNTSQVLTFSSSLECNPILSSQYLFNSNSFFLS